jgi:hypothetical protein
MKGKIKKINHINKKAKMNAFETGNKLNAF